MLTAYVGCAEFNEAHHSRDLCASYLSSILQNALFAGYLKSINRELNKNPKPLYYNDLGQALLNPIILKDQLNTDFVYLTHQTGELLR